MGLFWRRKKDEFVSLRLNEPAPSKVEEKQPPTPAPARVPVPIEAKPEAPPVPVPAQPPAETVREKPVPSRSPFQTSVLGLDRSIEELQAQEAALEQEFSARFRRAVAATRESLSET